MAANKIRQDKERLSKPTSAKVDNSKAQARDAAWWKAQDDAYKAGKDTFEFGGKTYPLKGKGVAEGDELNVGIEAYGVRGPSSKKWRKTFKNQAAFERWLDANEGDVEVLGTREVNLNDMFKEGVAEGYDIMVKRPQHGSEWEHETKMDGKKKHTYSSKERANTVAKNLMKGSSSQYAVAKSVKEQGVAEGSEWEDETDPVVGSRSQWKRRPTPPKKEQGVTEGSPQSLGTALRNTLSRVEPGSKLDKKIRHHNDMVRRFGTEAGTMTSAPDGYHIDKKGFVRLGEGMGAYDNDKGIKHTRESLVAKLESLPKGDDDFEWNRIQAIQHLKQGNPLRARYYMAKMKRGEQGVAEGKAVYYHVVDDNNKSIKAFMYSQDAIKFVNDRRKKDPTANKWKVVAKKNAVIGEQGVAEGGEWDEYTGGNPFPDSDDLDTYGGEHDPDDLDESSGTEYRGFDIRASREYGTGEVVYWIYYRGRCTEHGSRTLNGAKKDIDQLIAAGFFNDPDEIARKKQHGLAEGDGTYTYYIVNSDTNKNVDGPFNSREEAEKVYDRMIARVNNGNMKKNFKIQKKQGVAENFGPGYAPQRRNKPKDGFERGDQWVPPKAPKKKKEKGVAEGEYDPSYDPDYRPYQKPEQDPDAWKQDRDLEEPSAPTTVTVRDAEGNVVLQFPSTGGYYGDVRVALSKGYDTESGNYDIKWKRDTTEDSAMIEDTGATSEQVASEIVRRIIFRHKDAISAFGPEAIMAAAREVGEYFAGAEELGTSDIGIATKYTLEKLDQMSQGNLQETASGGATGAGAVATTPAGGSGKNVGSLFGGTYKQKRTKKSPGTK